MGYDYIEEFGIFTPEKSIKNCLGIEFPRRGIFEIVVFKVNMMLSDDYIKTTLLNFVTPLPIHGSIPINVYFHYLIGRVSYFS